METDNVVPMYIWHKKRKDVKIINPLYLDLMYKGISIYSPYRSFIIDFKL
jgi:hypothetical protein